MKPNSWITEGFEAFRKGTFGNAGQNIYVSKKGVLQRIYQYDLDRNGVVDFVVYERDAPPTVDGVVYKSLDELDLSDEGYIELHADVERKFDESKDYLYPIPTEDIVLTQGVVKQNPGWDDMDGLDF